MFSRCLSHLFIISLSLILVSGCKSTGANIENKINSPLIKVENDILALTPNDREIFIELLLKHHSNLKDSSYPLEFVTFDSSYQIDTENGRIVVSLQVSENGLLEMVIQDDCTSCDELVHKEARKVYEQVAALYKAHAESFISFVESYDAFQIRVVEKSNNLEVVVVDSKERLSPYNLDKLASTIKVKPITEKSKKEAFSFNRIIDLEEAIKMAIIDVVNVERFKVSYLNITTIGRISKLESPFIVQLKDLSADLLPDSFTINNEDLSVFMAGTGVSVSNRTASFIEFKKISIYYGSNIFSLQPKNDVLPPMSESMELISELPFFGRYNHKRLISITSREQQVPFGFAIKYRIGNEEKTFFETTDVSNTLTETYLTL
jgi:hypothetical protein